MGDGGQSRSQKEAARSSGGQKGQFMGTGVEGRSQREEVGEDTQGAKGSSLSVFPQAGGFRPEKQPQGIGAGECGEGVGLALGLRPGSFYSSQN